MNTTQLMNTAVMSKNTAAMSKNATARLTNATELPRNAATVSKNATLCVQERRSLGGEPHPHLDAPGPGADFLAGLPGGLAAKHLLRSTLQRWQSLAFTVVMVAACLAAGPAAARATEGPPGPGAVGHRTRSASALGGMLFETAFGVLVVPGLHFILGTRADGKRLLRDEVEEPLSEEIALHA